MLLEVLQRNYRSEPWAECINKSQRLKSAQLGFHYHFGAVVPGDGDVKSEMLSGVPSCKYQENGFYLMFFFVFECTRYRDSLRSDSSVCRALLSL